MLATCICEIPNTVFFVYLQLQVHKLVRQIPLNTLIASLLYKLEIPVQEGKTTDLVDVPLYSDDNMVVPKTVITRAPCVIVSGGRVPVRMGPGPTNSYVDSRAKCETKRNRRQLAMLSLKYWTMFIQQSAQFDCFGGF